MELRRYLTILRRRWYLIALAVVVAVAFTILTADQSSTYTARSKLYVGANTFTTEAEFNPNLSGDQTAGLSQLIRTFAEMIDSAPVAEDAVDLTGAPRSAAAVVASTTATPGKGTNLLTIEVTDEDPAVAQQLATGLAEAFVENITDLESTPQEAVEGDVPSAPARIFERAGFPTVPTTEPLASKLFIAALVGFALSAGAILLADYLDLSIKSPADAEHRLELPVLGVIPVLVMDPAKTLVRPLARARPDLAAVEDG